MKLRYRIVEKHDGTYRVDQKIKFLFFSFWNTKLDIEVEQIGNRFCREFVEKLFNTLEEAEKWVDELKNDDIKNKRLNKYKSVVKIISW